MYLFCRKCNGYYELQEGESPDDFDKECECGSTLEYIDDLDEITGKNEVKQRADLPKEYLPPIFLIMLGILNICGLIYNLTFIMILGLIGILFGLIYIMILVFYLEKVLKMSKITYLLFSILFLIESIALIILWPHVDIYSRGKVGIPFFVFFGLIASGAMLIKIINPDSLKEI